MNTPHCSYPSCDRKARRGKLCDGHSQQLRRGKPLSPLRAKRRQGASLERDEAGRKQCLRCKQWKTESEYEPHSKASDGLKVHCRKCTRFYWKARRNNLTPAGLESLLEEHGSACGICKTPITGGSQALAIDHDHACCPGTGKSCGRCIRGLLCSNCNTGLGSFMDDPQLLRAAIAYLGSTPWGYSHYQQSDQK